MKVMLCEDADWLLSEEAFSIYASCMYHPTYKDYKGQMDDLLCDPSTKVFVYEDQGRKTGMIILKFSDAAAEIIGIAVSVDARRTGHGNPFGNILFGKNICSGGFSLHLLLKAF